MKIAILIPSFLPKCSGAEIFHHHLTRQLLAAGHQPVLIIPRRNVEQLRRENWTLPYLVEPFPANLWSLFKRSAWLTHLLAGHLLDRLQARHHFDLWHVVMTYPTGVAALHWQGGRHHVPVLLRCAGDDLLLDRERGVGLRLDPLIDRLIRQELPKARAVISLSESITQEYRALGVPPARIEWIPNAVDLPRFQQPIDRAAVRARLGLAADDFVFLSVGRNHPQKDYPTLLDAAVRLRGVGKKFRLLIVGREAPKLQDPVNQMRLGQIVSLLEMGPDAGATDRLAFPPAQLLETYLAADAFVMPSLIEGFSTALLEAMAAGLPVLTTDAPGCREFIRDGLDGLMVPRGDANKLAVGMARLLENADLCAEYAAKSRARATEFAWPAILARYLALYQRLISH